MVRVARFGTARCRRPIVIRKAQLAAALRFEFELKIDGRPLGRSARAMAAFTRPEPDRDSLDTKSGLTNSH